MKNFTKQDALRNLKGWIDPANKPSNAEISAELERLQALSGAEKRDVFIGLGKSDHVLDLEDRFDSIEDRDCVGVFTLNADQALFRNVQNIVLFARQSDGVADVLSKLNLSYRDGAFTNTGEGVNILFISYQLRFAADGVVNGYREGLIRQGSTYDYARSQMTAISGAATHVSGSIVLRLTRNDSFHVRALHTDASNINLVTASSGTKLTIAKL